MEYQIKLVEKRTIAGFHLVGPWELTVKQGFEQLSMWVQNRHIQPIDWICAYYDNPDDVPAEKLRADVVVSVPDDFVIPRTAKLLSQNDHQHSC